MEESKAVELANVALREEMLRFNIITDAEDPYPLALLLVEEDRKVLVPVFEHAGDPEQLPEYGTMYKHANGVELHVFTSVLHIPDGCDAPGVCFIPFAFLLEDIIENGGVDILRIDPGTEHGVGFIFKAGKPRMFGLKRLERVMQAGE